MQAAAPELAVLDVEDEDDDEEDDDDVGPPLEIAGFPSLEQATIAPAPNAIAASTAVTRFTPKG